jgi:hypothetical protein
VVGGFWRQLNAKKPGRQAHKRLAMRRMRYILLEKYPIIGLFPFFFKKKEKRHPGFCQTSCAGV